MRTSILIVLLVSMSAYASGGRDHDATATATSGDASAVVGGKSRALGLAGSDMVINDGYRTYSVLFGLWQDTKVNPLSLARDLAAEGNFHAAAILRCKPKAVRDAFGGEDFCIEALSTPPTVMPVVVPDEHIEDEEEYHEEQQMVVADLEAKLANLEQAQADERERRRAAAAAAARREMEQREYAKQTLEELKEWK